MRTLTTLLLIAPLTLAQAYGASVFDKAEMRVAASPSAARQVAMASGARVVDTDVSPAAPVTAILVLTAGGTREVLLWDARQAEAGKVWEAPAGFAPRALAWHPEGKAIFLAGPVGQRFAIQRLDQVAGKWTARQIYSSALEIRRLVPAPRPFEVDWDKAHEKPVSAYRVFFGLKAASGSYTIHSITEEGKVEYQAIGPKATQTKLPDAEFPPSAIVADNALPVGFHPAGHILLWEDGKHCFHTADYARDHWEGSARLLDRDVCGGTASVTPNGAGLIRWETGKPGVELVMSRAAAGKRMAESYTLVSAPSSVPDGRGIVGITKVETGFAVAYIPVDVPLADVVNAWMYLESEKDLSLFAGNGGLFRDLKDSGQLYQLYDSELYRCGSFDESGPARPYMVTTDAFWELFAAAYEGIFIVRERQTAIPAFWDFVTRANGALAKAQPQSKWAGVFAVLAALKDKPAGNPEAQWIARADGRHVSPVVGMDFDYAELKPRGHYTATPAQRTYFQAFRYLTRVSALKEFPAKDLAALPADVKTAALAWIGAYQDMIAPSRAPMAWGASTVVPRYVKRPVKDPVLFPLAWGFDNEALNATVFHSDYPAAERIEGPSGRRMAASAVDVAAALGSRFARELLAGELAKYPNLARVLDEVAARKGAADARPTLYDQWIDGLAQQWADSVASPNGALDEKIWRTKRLQTGLASWATLRHATVLVNERSGAECGEGGFEALLMRPPRGYVEPDPETFSRIAALFDAASKMIAAPETRLTGMLPLDPDSEKPAREALKLGLVRRLNETAAKARLFQAMAAKEVRGEALAAKEYEEILYFGRVAEHHFLVFKSLANKDLALTTPDPMPKIADVADVAGGAPYLMAAVGRPIEWDHTVPFFGRKEIVKGPAYSFYEFVSNTLLNDAEWLKQLPSQPRPAWVAPYLSANPLSCPAKQPF